MLHTTVHEPFSSHGPTRRHGKTTYYYLLRPTTTYYYLLLPTITYYYLLLPATYDLPFTTHYHLLLPTTYHHRLLHTPSAAVVCFLSIARPSLPVRRRRVSSVVVAVVARPSSVRRLPSCVVCPLSVRRCLAVVVVCDPLS